MTLSHCLDFNVEDFTVCLEECVTLSLSVCPIVTVSVAVCQIVSVTVFHSVTVCQIVRKREDSCRRSELSSATAAICQWESQEAAT